MKYTTQVLQKEGFDAIFRITFENGLVLSSENVIWLGKRRADEIKEQFDQFLSFLDMKEKDGRDPLSSVSSGGGTSSQECSS